QARAALLRSLFVGTLLALLLAVAAAVVVSRRVSRPLVALAAATRSFAAGEPHPDRLIRRAPGELGEVGRAFTAMTATLTHQDEQRRALIADVAHELRTPVAILRGQTEQLLDGIAEPTTDRLVSLHDEVLRLERVTEDLATLSAADAAGLALRTEPVDLGQLAARTVDAMQAHFDDAELTAHADVDDDVVVHGDPTRLSQVVTNLLTNAAKFTPPGGRITVEVHRAAQGAELVVTDTGPGIPPDELPHLFDRFWRGRAAGTRSGTGIGLSVVASLVAAHGGTVTARAPADGGAQFTVTLPTISRPGPVAEGSTVEPVAH
ncbi:MAG TPA: HAMP domain-containing sensor histidine kinase, partial [Actinomycetes bacterium]